MIFVLSIAQSLSESSAPQCTKNLAYQTIKPAFFGFGFFASTWPSCVSINANSPIFLLVFAFAFIFTFSRLSFPFVSRFSENLRIYFDNVRILTFDSRVPLGVPTTIKCIASFGDCFPAGIYSQVRGILLHLSASTLNKSSRDCLFSWCQHMDHTAVNQT